MNKSHGEWRTMGLIKYSYMDIEIEIDEDDLDGYTSIDDCKRLALEDFLVDHTFTMNFIGMGDDTSDVYLLWNGEELASKMIADCTQFTIEDMRAHLFDEFIEENLDKFRKIKSGR